MYAVQSDPESKAGISEPDTLKYHPNFNINYPIIGKK